MPKPVAQTQAASAASPRLLVGVCAAVVLAHLLLLQSVAAHWRPALAAMQRPLQLRSLTLNAPPVNTAAQPAPANAAAAPPAAATQPKAQSRALVAAAENPGSDLPKADVRPAPEATETVAILQPPVAPPEPLAAPPNPPETAAAPVPSGGGPAITLPASARLKYEVQAQSKGNQYQANAELLWRHDGQQYEARMEVSAFLIGSRLQTSQGTLGPAGLQPLRFSNKSRNEQAAHFDYPGSRIRFSANTPDAPLLAGTQDRVSVVLQLASLVAGEPLRYASGGSISLPTVGQRDVDQWVFQIEEAAPVNLPGGEELAVKLIRQPRREFDITVEIWLAPAQGYLPVRIKLTQANGDFVDQLWRSTAAP